MSKKPVIAELENLCEQLDIKVRYEKTSARGGLCRLDDKYYIIIDKKTNEDFRIDVLVRELKNFDLTDIFISPRLREMLEI